MPVLFFLHLFPILPPASTENNSTNEFVLEMLVRFFVCVCVCDESKWDFPHKTVAKRHWNTHRHDSTILYCHEKFRQPNWKWLSFVIEFIKIDLVLMNMCGLLCLYLLDANWYRSDTSVFSLSGLLRFYQVPEKSFAL